MRSYTLLLVECNSLEHPFQYAAIKNSYELAKSELERVVLTKKLEDANDESKHIKVAFDSSNHPRSNPNAIEFFNLK